MEGIIARELDEYEIFGYVPVWFKLSHTKEFYCDNYFLGDADVDSFRRDLWVSVGPKCLIEW